MNRSISFTKMHGLENDYIFLDAVRDPELAKAPGRPGLTVRMCHRYSGIGGDGVIVVSRAPGAGGATDAVAMRIYNSDGSDGGMCGNGARCVLKLAVDRGHLVPGPGGRVRLFVGERELHGRVEMDADGKVGRVSIDMGEPVLELARIPVDRSRIGVRTEPLHLHEHFVDGWSGVFVNVGNPHMVIFTQQDPEHLADAVGPALERHAAFPERINSQFVKLAPDGRLMLRTWERGAGRTRACGTGACAAVVAGVLTDRCPRRATVAMLGGELEIEWIEGSNRIIMTGPAVEVCEGVWAG